MADNAKLKSLVDQMPDPDRRGMYTENIDKEKVERAIAEIHQGGPDNIRGLIEMLGEPGSIENVKPHYALHCVINQTLIAKDEQRRKQFCEVLASELGGDRPQHQQQFFCQELEWAGHSEALPGLAKLLTDQELSSDASMALVAIKEGAAEQFRKAWPQATGKARQCVIDGLARLGDQESAEIFKEGLSDDDREVRIAAAAGLARIAQADAANSLLEAAESAEGWERIQLTANCLELADNLRETGQSEAAKTIYERLKKSRAGESDHIRSAVERG